MGVLKGRLADAVFVTRSGGRIRESTGRTLRDGLPELIALTQNDSIRGFFLDTFTYMHTKRHFHETGMPRQVLDFIMNQSTETEVEFPGAKEERSVYGILIKDKRDFEYFRYAFEDHKEEFDMCERWGLNIRKTGADKKKKQGIFSPSGGHFWPLFTGNVVVLLVLLCFGIVYEIVRIRYNKTHGDQKTVSPPEENGVGAFNNIGLSESAMQ